MKYIYSSGRFLVSKGLVYLLILYTLFRCSIVYSQTSYKKQFKLLDEYFSQSVVDFQMPGMAIAIIKDDSVIFSKGYGYLEMGKPERVDSRTIFAIASNTKAFTSAAVAVLVDEGKLKWDDKVTKYLPWFQLYDPYVTFNMTIRDLLCHRSGLATFSGDLLWYATTYSREEVITRARYLQPRYGFRERYGYSNIMFLAAGEVVHAVSSQSWDDFVSEKFFKPLRMDRTCTSTNDLKKFENVASPHTDFAGNTFAIPYLNWDNIAPAGSICSCVEDLSKWIKLHLNRGKLGSVQIFSEDRSREMWSPNTLQNVSIYSEKNYPSTHFKAYALGWGVNDYLGRKIVSHSGGYDGMTSFTCLIPEERLGFVILTNKNSSLYSPLSYKILDIFLNGGDTDWCALMLENMKKQEEDDKMQQKQEENERVTGTKPTLDLNSYAGLYGGILYGNAKVSVENNELRLVFAPAPQFNAVLKHWQYDTFTVRFEEFPSLPQGKVNFIINAAGRVEEMRIDVPNPDFDFTELIFKKFE